MAEAGYAVLQIDMFGCGDSDGDFSSASWGAWQDDVLTAYRWLRTQTDAPLFLWGLRSGCLLAASVADRFSEVLNYIFWQPVISGKLHWQQFMRLKLAGELVSGAGKEVMEVLRQRLDAGLSVEIVGYSVSPEIAQGLQQTDLTPKPQRAGHVVWLEVSSREDAAIAPASQRYIEQWREIGFSVEAAVVPGPAFWQTTEIEDAPKLVEATMQVLARLQ